MQEPILESSLFREISFTSETIQPIGENAWNVSGNLQLHGQTRVIHLSVHKVDGRYIGSTTIRQTDHGIQPTKNELKNDFVIDTK